VLDSIRLLGKHSFIYGLGSLLNNLLGFILIPIYTRYLVPSDYGILSLLIATSGIASMIAQLGLGTALFREVIYKESDEVTVESTAFYFLIGESSLFFGVLIIFSPQLSGLIFSSLDYAHLLRLIFLTCLLSMFNVIVMARLRIHEQSALFAMLSVASFLVGAVLNIYFIVILERGVEGLITAGLILAALSAVVCMVLFVRYLRLTFSISVLRNMLAFGVPLVPANLSSLVMTSADLYFLQYYSTTAELGLYSLGYKIGMVMNLAVQAVQQAWPAQMFVIAKSPNAEHQFAKILTYYLVILGFVGVALSVLAREFLIIMTTPEFYRAYTVVALVALSYLLYGVRFITNISLPIQNKMKYMPPIIMSAAALNLGLNYLLIPRYGMMGAAWATVISYLVLVVINGAVNLHFWYIPYEYGRILKVVLAWGLIYGGSLLVQTSNHWLDCGIKLLLLATYPFLLYTLCFYEKQELDNFVRLLRTGIHHLK